MENSLIRKIQNKTTFAILTAVLAAVLYGISSPVSKLLLTELPPSLMAALLYIGAGLGMFVVNLKLFLNRKEHTEAKMTKKVLPYIIGMILLDIAAPILLMTGLKMTNAANAALLNNFEIAATALIALLIFKEAVGKRMWIAISFITVSCIILSVKDFTGFSFSAGSIFILIACLCWGLENNCTRMLSLNNPLHIVVIKGFGSGLGALIISIALKEFSNNILYIFFTLILGFVSYGLSIFFYIKAQRELGAARTSAYYASAPFVGVLISWLLLNENILPTFYAALVLMIIGSYFAISERHQHSHLHIAITHEHKHCHNDLHHNHECDLHANEITGEHCHEHFHPAYEHNHSHTPDMHHKHLHNN